MSLDSKREILFLAALSLVCVLLNVVRYLIMGNWTYLFLTWNLFLALIPWAITTFALARPRGKQRRARPLLGALLLAWFIFFPNAPYVLTDLMYLQRHAEKMFWFDLVLLQLFSFAAILPGFFSLRSVEAAARQRLGAKGAALAGGIVLLLAAVGVYMGRSLRWNSWDIFAHPASVFTDLADLFLHPIRHRLAWQFVLIFGFLLNVLYWSFRFLLDVYPFKQEARRPKVERAKESIEDDNGRLDSQHRLQR